MQRHVKAMLSSACAAAIGLGAGGGTVIIDGLGGAVTMQSKDIGGVFGAGDPIFTDDALRAVHEDLHSDGIVTDGYVSFVLADTDHGLSWLTLVDDDTVRGPRGRDEAQMGMSSTAPDTGIEFVNDSGNDIELHFDPHNGTQTAAGFFTWNHVRRGDGFAWANLVPGDFVSFNFDKDGPDHNTFPGLNETDTFQFVHWNGDSWEIVATAEFSSGDQFAFTFSVIPLPAPVLLGMAGLGLAAIMRRRFARQAA